MLPVGTFRTASENVRSGPNHLDRPVGRAGSSRNTQIASSSRPECMLRLSLDETRRGLGERFLILPVDVTFGRHPPVLHRHLDLVSRQADMILNLLHRLPGDFRICSRPYQFDLDIVSTVDPLCRFLRSVFFSIAMDKTGEPNTPSFTATAISSGVVMLGPISIRISPALEWMHVFLLVYRPLLT